jgi:hydrogenase maturation factor
MNLVYGEVIEVLREEGVKIGKVRVDGAVRKVPLELLAAVDCGDKVLLCDGAAISRVKEPRSGKENNVLSDPGEIA